MSTVPKFIDYERLQDLSREFGFDPKYTQELRFTQRALIVTAMTLDDNGKQVVDAETNTVVTHEITIPVSVAPGPDEVSA